MYMYSVPCSMIGWIMYVSVAKNDKMYFLVTRPCTVHCSKLVWFLCFVGMFWNAEGFGFVIVLITLGLKN